VLPRSLTESSARNIYWEGKGGRCVGQTTLPPSCADCLKIWEPQPAGTLQACNGIALLFIQDNSIKISAIHSATADVHGNCKKSHGIPRLAKHSGLCSWDRVSQFNVNKCPTRRNYKQFILSVNCSTCFERYLHPSSEAQITAYF